MAKAALSEHIEQVRDFNRFYTRRIGVLEDHFLQSPFSLAEARVLYELAHGGRATAKEIGEALELDAGYLSRILDRFSRARLISREASPSDGRKSFITLTKKGRAAFAPLDKRSREEVGAMLKPLPERDRQRMISAMKTIASLVDSPKAERPVVSLRAPRHGDFGWIVARHAELYAEEYGWGDPFEGLCAQIAADFVNNFDPKRECCWIAECNGENAGSVMLVKDDKPGVARLRLLLVEPRARGLGIGTRLTDECIRFARKAGYRSITLWTHSVLTGARRIYEKAGFTLTSSEKRRSWGKDVVAEFWDLKL